MYTTVHYVASGGSGGRQTRGVLRIVEVDSADDPRLADYTRLTDAGLRTHLEAERGLFIAEGTKVITRAVAAGYPVRSMLLGRSRLVDLESLPDARRRPRLRGPGRGRRAADRLPRAPGGAGVARPQAAAGGRRADRGRAPDRRARGSGRPRQRRGDLPLRGRARGGRGGAVAPVRRPALPAVGQGLDGRGVRDPVRPDERLVRRPGRPEVGRLPRPRAHPG